ncbi:YicC family protein [Caulobacter segnis]|uniref:YicC/YloC family endoribonuclease n=1 Tax=Caulobacter segnis TaxID=88688 RepID=UPI00240FCE8D|nr:YicC/YloC family endoribonuclease [Caulobacter segnis]MDG2522359.1 YicC family protein [Caulobacter segnis]
MTGFARAEGALGAWTWAVEARSVNGRNLETRFRGPPGFDALDRAAREGSQARFQRGQVTIGVTAKQADAAGQISVNIAQLERYLSAGQPYVATGLAEKPRLDGLLALKGVLESAEEGEDAEAKAAIEQAMAASLAVALDGLKAARGEEGRALTPVLTGLVDRIEALVASAEKEAAVQPAALKDKLAKRMAELLGDNVSEEKILQEAAALALRADVREELDRLAGHIASARTLLTGDGAVGRKLDFLTQEFMRESNTLCSKSGSTALTAIGLDLKATVDQFREQVQNVE